jgi:hypothetical protein
MASTTGILRKLNKLIFYLSISTWFNPLNFKSEREKFLKSKTYEPQFIYPEFNLEKLFQYRAIVGQLQDYLKNSNFDKDYQTVLWEKTTEAKLYLELLRARGKSELSGISAKLYQCTFDNKMRDLAKKDIQIKFLANKEFVKTEELIKRIKNCLLDYKEENWEVTESNESGFYCRIFPEKKLIVVNKKIDWDFFTLDGFIAHEIDGHVVRTINSQNQINVFYKFQLPF